MAEGGIMKIKYAVMSGQGPREEMEDTHCLKHPFLCSEQMLFAGVFDGHGSALAAKQAAQLIPSVFSQRIEVGRSVRRAFRESYQIVSDSLRSFPGGVCAATLFLRPPIAFFANVGDCGLWALRRGHPEELTTAHRVGNRSEEERVRKYGGRISQGYVWVDSDGLQPFRTLGDAPFKKVGVIAEPECGFIRVTQPTTLFLATDGVSDLVAPQEIEDILRLAISVEAQATRLKDHIELTRPHDNYTFIIVSFRP